MGSVQRQFQDPAANGSTAAPEPCVAQLYREHFDFTWRSLRHLGVGETHVEDAVQDLWMTVHRRAVDFEGRSGRKTWLFGIALNIARHHRRRSQRKPSQPLPPGELSCPAPSPEQACSEHQSLSLVQRYIDTLDEPRRILFVARLLEGLPAAECADLLGVDAQTVHDRVRFIRKSFRRWFEQQQETTHG